jgi:hypothetical protein
MFIKKYTAIVLSIVISFFGLTCFAQPQEFSVDSFYMHLTTKYCLQTAARPEHLSQAQQHNFRWLKRSLVTFTNENEQLTLQGINSLKTLLKFICEYNENGKYYPEDARTFAAQILTIMQEDFSIIMPYSDQWIACFHCNFHKAEITLPCTHTLCYDCMYEQFIKKAQAPSAIRNPQSIELRCPICLETLPQAVTNIFLLDNHYQKTYAQLKDVLTRTPSPQKHTTCYVQ